MTEHIRKRARELARDHREELLYSGDYVDNSTRGRGYGEAMLRTLPILERLMKPQHDDVCSSHEVVPFTLMPCNCTLGWAREEARKLVGP